MNDKGLLISAEEPGRKRHKCPNVPCGSPLWTGEIDRFEPARFIHKKLRGYFSDPAPVNPIRKANARLTFVTYALSRYSPNKRDSDEKHERRW
jgi:hypothetical protein